MVEIGKAIFNDSKILVMDEPTAVLTDKESKYFFDMVKKLKEKGVGIIYVSHRLEEVLELSDRITVLRDGECITELDNSKKTDDKRKTGKSDGRKNTGTVLSKPRVMHFRRNRLKCRRTDQKRQL